MRFISKEKTNMYVAKVITDEIIMYSSAGNNSKKKIAYCPLT